MKHLNEEQLVLYYYGEAGEIAGDIKEVEDHLGDCESCRDSYHALQRVLNSVDSLAVPERGPDYEARVWKALERQLPRRRSLMSRWVSLRPPAVAAPLAGL